MTNLDAWATRETTQAMPKIKRIPIDTYPENTAFLRREGNGYSPEQFQALRKIRIEGRCGEILATLALVDGDGILAPGEIGLGEQAFRRLGQSAAGFGKSILVAKRQLIGR